MLLGLLRERDPELDTHVQRVARLARRLGRELGVDADELRNLVAAAELHDIGKAAIPDAILRQAAARSTTQEWDFIRRHTVIGERIIASAPALAPVSRRSCARPTSALTAPATPTRWPASRSRCGEDHRGL